MADQRFQIPAYDQDTELFTVSDAIEHVLDAFAVDESPRHLRVAHRSVLDAYRDLPNRRQWSYYYKRGSVTTAATQTSSTITYDHTGGTYERQVTLASGTWPTNAELYGLLIGDDQYKVEAYKTSTVITLTQDSNPGADVASGTSYTLYRAVYPLPIDFRRMHPVEELTGSWWPQYVQPHELLSKQVARTTPQEPYFYTIRGGGEYYSGMVMEFGPPPDTAKRYDFMYERSPRKLSLPREASAGTVSISGTTVTGTSTRFDSRMVGSILRVPSSRGKGAEPTSYIGDNPFEEQAVVTAVASATSATIGSSVGTVSGSKYTVSDPIDVEPGAMLTALLRLAESRFARYTSKEDRKEREAEAERAMRLAAEADSRVSQGASGSSYDPFRHTTVTQV